MTIETRVCSVCAINKDLNATCFGHTPKGGFRNVCRTCKNLRERAYDNANPDKVKAKWQRQNPKRLAAGDLWTKQDISLMRIHLSDSCLYCAICLDGGGEVDHIVPLDSGGTNAIYNLTLSCRPCNRAKGNKTVDQFLATREKRSLQVRNDVHTLLAAWQIQQVL